MTHRTLTVISDHDKDQLIQPRRAVTAVVTPRGDIPGASELTRAQAGGDHCCYCAVLMPWEKRRFIGALATDAWPGTVKLCDLYACVPDCETAARAGSAP